MTRAALLQYVAEQYGVEPDHPWESDPTSAVLRHRDNKKWFALVMKIGRDRLGLSGHAPVDAMNVKCDPLMIGSMRMNTGVLPAYHMNKNHWLTVLLDGTADDETVKALVDMSYALTAPKKKAPKPDA